MKQRLTPHVIKELQMQTVRYTALSLEWPKSRTLTMTNVGKDMEQHRFSFVPRNTKWYSHTERQFGSFLKNQTYYHRTPLSHFLEFTQRTLKSMSIQ